MEKAREANIELLRIVSMILVIAGHFVGQNDVIEILDGFPLFIALLFGSAPRIAVNVFLIIGIWFMLDKQFSARKILSLYGEVWFYGITLTVIVILLGGNLSVLSILRVIFPFSLRGVWFASSYIALMLVSPFLKLLLDKFDEDMACKFVFLLFFLICIMNFFNKTQDHWIDNLTWFSFVYLAVGVYKKYYNEKRKYNYKIIGLIGILLYVIMVIVIFSTCKKEESVWARYAYKFFYSWILDIKSLPNIMCAGSLFYFFTNFHISRGAKIINLGAKHAFSVYVIHQTGTFIRFMWDRIFRCAEWIRSPYFVFLYGLTVSSIYLGCMPIDWARRKFFEPVYIRSRLFRALENKINSFYKWCK